MSTAPSQAIATDKLVRVLCQSLALELAFLEMCDEDELHPDVAVKRMENIANELGELSPAELEAFFSHVRALADEQRRYPQSAELVQFLDNLRDHLGFGAEDQNNDDNEDE